MYEYNPPTPPINVLLMASQFPEKARLRTVTLDKDLMNLTEDITYMLCFKIM